MARYAYKDIKRENVIYAANAVEEDREKVFYCPNSLCKAHLYICAVNGSKNAYFRATKKQYPHINNCPFASKSIDFNAENFNETEFIFDEAIDKLFFVSQNVKNNLSGKDVTGQSKIHPPRTIMQIYSMCKSYPVTEKYGDKEIGDMILDDRSAYRYPKGCFGNRVIEACINGRFYNKDDQQIILFAPIGSRKYSFIINIEDSNIYRVIQKEVYNNQNKTFVIAGKWKASEKYNCFVSELYSRKQIAVIK